MSALFDMTGDIDRICADELGDPITYIPAGRIARSINAHVLYDDQRTDLGAGQMIEQDIEVHILKSDLDAKPAAGDRMILPRWPTLRFKPTNPSTDKSGTHWIVAAKVAV